MADIEKVIKWADKCLSSAYSEECNECPYQLNHEGLYSCVEGILRDAIALLKEQEAVTIKRTKEHGFGVYGGICPKCRNWIQSAHSFCGFCGQAVKWE